MTDNPPVLAAIDTFRNQIIEADALTLLNSLPSQSIDAIVTDPPYPEIKRDYGTLSEDEWMKLMTACVIQMRRILKPSGSAMMVLQPNQKHVGSMRLWLHKFIVWCGEYWNVVQDAYWWNFTVAPTVHVSRGLMRPSVKMLVWIGDANCYRDQSKILWKLSDAVLAVDKSNKALQYLPSGLSVRKGRIAETAIRNGGSTPFNLLPLPGANVSHGASTPAALIGWMIKYISPKGGIVCDPFMGAGTTGLVARRLGRDYVGCDLNREYVEMARKRIDQEDPTKPKEFPTGEKQLSLFAKVTV